MSYKRYLKIFIPFCLGIALVWYSLSQISFETLIGYFKDANYFWVLLGVSMGIVSHLTRAYRWLLLAEPLGYKPHFLNSGMAVYAAYLINLTIPRAGEVARATIITNYEQIPFQKGFGTIVAERVIDTFMLLLVIGITFILEFDFIYSFFSEKFQLDTLLLGSGLFVLILILTFLWISKSSSSFAQKVKTFIKGLLEGLLSVFKMKRKWTFIACTLIIWVLYVFMFYVTTFALPELESISLAAVLVGFILASFSIAATNGGIGSFPEAIVLAFIFFSLPEDPSRAFGWILWSVQTLVIIILGGLSLIMLPIYNKNKKAFKNIR